NLTLATARAHADKLAALGQAAARIAHEIRNPLAAARSLVQLVGQNDGSRELTEPAVGELDRIGRLVSDLLAFSRRDDVRAREEVDMAAVCRAALAEVAPLAQTLNVDVVWVLAPAALVGDEGRMVQAVSNLCRNAVEAAAGEWGTGRVTVSCRTANELVAIEGPDSGPGILAGEVGRGFAPCHTTK